MIDAVLFDGDQTLWGFESVMRHALTRTLGALHRPSTSDLTITVTRCPPH